MKSYYLLVAFLFGQLLIAQNYHDTQGKLEISNSGQSVYTVPIALPPSIQEVGPTINLIYSSGQMGGIAGIGWSINSISVISRIATRKDIDGFIDGVDFDENDKLALDGQRLILTSGTYWSDGSTYETETKSNSKIELAGSGSTIYFIVTTPDGSRAWYGNFGGINATDLTSFYITRFEDVNGNYMTYHYSKPYNKSLCISEIKFSANILSGITPQNEIKFFYDLAKRSENVFIKGVKHEKVELLKRIEVYTNTNLFRKYVITHQADPQLAYEKVTKVQEFNGNNQPANPIEFEYENIVSSNVDSEIITTYVNNLNFNVVKLSGDFDGDGRLDFTTGNRMYTNLFQGGAGSPGVVLPFSTEGNTVFTATTIAENKLNQKHSIIKAFDSVDNIAFRAYNYNPNNNLIELNYTKTIAFNNNSTHDPDWDDYEPSDLNINNCTIPTVPTYEKEYLEGDFNGDGISEVLLLNRREYYYFVQTGSPYNNGTYVCNTEKFHIEECFLINLDPNASTTLGENGYVQLPVQYLLYGRKNFVMDFNGDGKSDILTLDTSGYALPNYLGPRYRILSFKQLTEAPWVELELIGQGYLTDYSPDKQMLFGDYNGDGKVDIMMPNGDGSNAQRNDTLWHIYYSNPNPAGGSFFTKESHNIVEYWPNSGNYFDTQTHFNNFYSLDTNGDGKSDLVRVWRKYYKPNWTINDHDTQWEIKTYINNIGNTTSSGSKFTLDYSSASNHYSDSPDLPIPIVSTYKYQGLNREIVMIRNHYNQATYINFNKNFADEILLKKVISSGGNIVDEIAYKSLESDTPGTNGLGTLNQFYSSSDAVNYPLVELKRIPTSKAVSELKNTAMDIIKKQDFRYHGLVVNMDGIGAIGFRKTARSAWYLTSKSKRIWSVEENNATWRGATQRRYSQLITNGNSFSFVSSGNPSGIINSTVNSFSHYLTGSVFNLVLNNQTTTDYLTNVKSEILYTYSTPYLLPETVVTKNYLNQITLQGTTTTNSIFENNPTGLGSNYYIGRLKQVNTTISAYNDTFSTEEKYTYTGNKLTKKESKANNTDNVYLTETYEYFPNGNLKKKILNAPGATPAVSARTTEYTYDTSQRFIKTVKDIEGLITTYNSYHPLYGVVLSETNSFGQTTSSIYDNWGKRTKVTDYLGKSINYTYAKSGNTFTTSTLADDGSESIIEMDIIGRVTKKGSKNINGSWSYISENHDFLNRKTGVSEPYFGNSPSQWTTMTYDDYSRLKQQISFTGLTTDITYTGLTVVSNDGIVIKSTTKNANGHTTQSVDPGGTINYAYFANGNMKTSTFDGVTLSMEYDGWGRKKKLTDPSAGVYEYEYNVYGETTKEITPKGNTQYYYSPTGRIEAKYVQGDLGDLTYNEIHYSYNPLKQLTLIDGSDINGASYYTEYFYDSNHRLQKQTESNPQSYFEKRYEYDDFGRVNREYHLATDVPTGKSSGKWIKNTYLNGYHWQVLDDATNAMLWQVDAVNARGQLVTGHYGNAVGQVSNTYDSYGLPLTSSYRTINGSNASPTPFLTLTTNFNAQRGLLLSRSNSMFNWNETFQYDSLERLTHFTNSQGQTEQQSYDNKGRITQNAIGNYAYETSAKPYQATKVSLSTSGVSYYSDKPLQQISYNAFKSPVSIYEKDKDRIDFEYNPFLTRSTMYYGDLNKNKYLRPYRKYYAADGTMEIKRNNLSNAVDITLYIGGDGYSAPIMVKSDGITQNYLYLHRDYLGSIMAISNAAGQVVEKRHFDAWGNIVFLKDQNNNNLTNFAVLDRGYTGHEHLQSVGLIHMNGRLYDAKVRRFLSPDNYIQDPSNTQNFNRYGYVLNNPLKHIDPSGEEGITLGAAVIIGAAVAALTYTITALTADVPFTAGGLIQSAAIGAFSAAVTFGIGEATSTITNLVTRTAAQSLAHGTFQGFMSGIQGGDFMTGFASGSLSSLAASSWSGGKTTNGSWNGVGGKFGHSTTGTLVFGTLAGGAGAALTKGNFWQGAVTGLIVSGLNHVAHSLNSQKNGYNLTKEDIKRIYENYPHPEGDSKVTIDELIALIGGPIETEYNKQSSLYEELNGNTCALRLSYAMNKAGYNVNGDYYGANGMKYFTSATRMTNNYLTKFNWQYVYPNPKNSTSIGLIAQYRSNGTVLHVDVIYNNKVGTNIYTQNVVRNVNWYPGN